MKWMKFLFITMLTMGVSMAAEGGLMGRAKIANIPI
jgi:hypothetical protein